MKSTKNIPFNKNQVIGTKDTFDTMERIVKKSKKDIELRPKINEVFKEINGYANVPNQYRTIRAHLHEDEYEQDYDYE